jgi:tRNA(Arg) A34 adenosine deaminase TadA
MSPIPVDAATECLAAAVPSAHFSVLILQFSFVLECVTATDTTLLRSAIAIAARARAHGNHPFGALLADSAGKVLLESENTVITGSDVTGHAETNLMREAGRRFTADQLATCTLYTSTEPCPMCAGAIFWGNVGRVVYGLGQDGLYALTGESPYALKLSCRKVFSHGTHPVEVLGPALEPEAATVHAGFWR